MRRTKRQKQVTVILALFVAVIGLSIGFAAFSTNLLISSSATVTPDSSDFGVKFSSSNTSLATSQITPTVSGATGDKATIDNSGTSPKITGLKANFTAPGQTVTYTFYSRNTGSYLAYLRNVTVGSKTCTATSGGGATASLVTSACNGISISVTVDGTAYTATKAITNDGGLAAGSSETVVVTITYASGAARADGPFTVAFGDCSLTYSSVQS